MICAGSFAWPISRPLPGGFCPAASLPTWSRGRRRIGRLCAPAAHDIAESNVQRTIRHRPDGTDRPLRLSRRRGVGTRGAGCRHSNGDERGVPFPFGGGGQGGTIELVPGLPACECRRHRRAPGSDRACGIPNPRRHGGHCRAAEHGKLCARRVPQPPPSRTARLLWDGLTHPRWTARTFLQTLIRHGMPCFENNDDGGDPRSCHPAHRSTSVAVPGQPGR
jgi:hypothetical protein